jgi:hypothetical protein
MFLNQKLVTACHGVPACRIAISKPPEDLSTLINSIQSSIVAWEKEHPNSTTTQAYFTDRRYRHASHNHTNRQYRKNTGRPKGKCYICQKETCRSWKHTDEDQIKARDKYKRRFNNSKGQNGNFGNFEKRFRQYVTYCEGDGGDKPNQAFESLIIDANDANDANDATATTAATDTKSDDPDESFFTSFGVLTAEEAASTSVELANSAFAAQLFPQTTELATETDPFNYTAAPTASCYTSRYTSKEFMGIIIDTGASTKSTAGYGQFQALQSIDHDVKLNTSTKGQVNIQFGIGSTSSIGIADITSPIGKVQFHIVHANTPFLLCLANMDRLQIKFDNLKDAVITCTQKVPVIRRFGYPFLLWSSSLKSYLCTSFNLNPSYLTDVELRRLHCRFGHPSADRL